MKKKVVVLHRVSTDGQDFNSQDNAIQEYIIKNKIIVDEYITEEGISGYSNKLYEREAIQKIDEMALLGELDTLIVFNIDRIGRTTEVSEFIKKLGFCNVKVISVTEGLLNKGEDMDDLINYFKSFFAQQESKKISLRSKNGKEATNKKGLFSGGRVNFGYGVKNQKMYIIDEEAQVVRLIFDLYIKEGKNAIVKYLNEKNITKRGRAFSQAMVHDILKDTVYIGLKRYNHYQKISNDPTVKTRRRNKDTMKYQDYKEELRIIPDEVFFKVQELIEGRSTIKGGMTKYTNKTQVLFEGLLYHRCGDREIRKLHLDRKTDKYGNHIYSYRCSHCRRNFYKDVIKTYGCKKYNPVIEGKVLDTLRNLKIEDIEHYMEDDKLNCDNLHKANLKKVEEQIDKKEKALKGANKELELIFSGESDMDRSIVNTLIKNLAQELNDLKENQKQLKMQVDETRDKIKFEQSVIDQYKNFNYAYDNADDKYRKILMQDVVEQITIDDDELKIKLYIS